MVGVVSVAGAARGSEELNRGHLGPPWYGGRVQFPWMLLARSGRWIWWMAAPAQLVAQLQVVTGRLAWV